MPRSLRRRLRSSQLRCTRDGAFAAVVHACATDRDTGTGTWIVPRLVDAYDRLHAAGWAHSVEVWAGDELVGGVFGIAVGEAFTGESMFHRRPDASKVALFSLAAHLRDRGFALLDVQLPTEHLTSMGAVAVPRAAFLRRLAVTVDAPVTF